jgi:hypothetical protein
MAFARHKDNVDTPLDRIVCCSFLRNNDRQIVTKLQIKSADADQSCPFSTDWLTISDREISL